MRNIVIVLLTLFTLTTTACGVGVLIGSSNYLLQPQIVQAADEPAEFSTFWQAWSIVHRHFVDRNMLQSQALT